MLPTRRVNWRLACTGAAILALLFAVQQWAGQFTSRRDLPFATSLALQMVTWSVWLALLPPIVRFAGGQPLAGRPTAAWLARTVAGAILFVLAHTILAGTLRWLLQLSVSPNLGTVIVNSFSAGFAANGLRYGAIVLVCHAVMYHDAVRDRERRAAQLELDLAQAKLASVEAALQPHFLFNTLNAIAALVREDPRQAERTIGELSDLLRASLAAPASSEVRFDDELTFTRRYLELERIRYQERLQVRIEASDEARCALVPHLLLQPLVENAIRHGIAPLESGGTIAVTARRHAETLQVTVSDDGVGLGDPTTAARPGIGLGGLRARLSRLYGDRHRLELRRGITRGTVVDVELPYRSAAS